MTFATLPTNVHAAAKAVYIPNDDNDNNQYTGSLRYFIQKTNRYHRYIVIKTRNISPIRPKHTYQYYDDSWGNITNIAEIAGMYSGKYVNSPYWKGIIIYEPANPKKNLKPYVFYYKKSTMNKIAQLPVTVDINGNIAHNNQKEVAKIVNNADSYIVYNHNQKLSSKHQPKIFKQFCKNYEVK